MKRRAYNLGARALATEANEKRILESAYALATELPYDEITLRAIAERALVSLQTVVNRFGSKENVVSEAFARVIEPARATATPGDVPGAIAILVDDYEKHGDVICRLLALEDRLPSISPILAYGRKSHRAWVERTLAHLLPRGKDRARRLAMLITITDVYAWKVLRRDQGLERSEVERSVVEMLAGLEKKNGGDS
jgi:AcrR family transcriptional regulator